ncbi:hypothetical protein POX_d04791 [Penicillium oxalicum]|uniref:hypothetical protein n=1 Tax=Penicillium oxalicum TaxID=69781 RepID=UPI0020B78FAF|nr:hypothetical protein POX_d04791 [Penicillium oxalicum]KAI2789305.1 hypothetical protein POX_d04791 [Penicillium oxalicum]
MPVPTSNPAATPTVTPARTRTDTDVVVLQQRGTEATTDYDPHITIHVREASIKPFSLTLHLPSNTCTPTITPDGNGYIPPSECNALYQYYPSFRAALAFSILFGILMITHLVQATIFKEAVRDTGDKYARSAEQPSGLATVTQLCILLSPLWVNAFDYMILLG